jgi:hypothetical protein
MDLDDTCLQINGPTMHFTLSLFSQTFGKNLVENGGQFNLKITFYTDFLVRNPNKDFKLRN